MHRRLAASVTPAPATVRAGSSAKEELDDRWVAAGGPPAAGGPVDSIEKLEALLLTWRQADATCTVAEAAERLHLPADNVGTALAELVDAGLLDAASDGYRFAAGASAQRAAVIRLCQIYERDRLLVLKEMTALAMDRIRNSAARAFSDAFRFKPRGPKKGGTDA